MRKNTASGIMLTLLLTSMLTLAFSIQPAKASGTIYIRADGSVEGTDKIQRDGDIYTFTAGIYDSIVIQRDNIVLDGAGYTLQGTGVPMAKGIDLTKRSNVTIKNMEIRSFRYGIYLMESSNNSIVGNNIVYNVDGVYLESSSNNTIAGNNVNNSQVGIYHVSSSNSSIAGNDIAYTIDGILLAWSSNNAIAGNNITTNYSDGIVLHVSSYNSITENKLTNNEGSGIFLGDSTNNNIARNDITTNYLAGVGLRSSSNNRICHNNFVYNEYQVYMDSPGYVNIWDDGYPSGGNYWSDYAGVDKFSGPYQNEAGSDGIGDAPYTIDANNQDKYPLMKPWALTKIIERTMKVGGKEYIIPIETNTTLTHVKATSVTLRFRSSGISGRTYYVNVTFPKINQTKIKVFIDDQELTPPPFPIITSNSTHYFIYIEFTASTHEITIRYATTNIATASLTPSKTVVGAGFTTSINVTVENQGIYTETFNVTVYANTTIISQTEITLTSGNSTTLTFTWNTTGFAKSNYVISAVADEIPGETDTTDNTYTFGIVITIIGDVNGDRIVDVFDLIKVGIAFGSKPGYANWNPNADLSEDNLIDVFDLIKVAIHFGEKDP